MQHGANSVMLDNQGWTPVMYANFSNRKVCRGVVVGGGGRGGEKGLQGSKASPFLSSVYWLLFFTGDWFYVSTLDFADDVSARGVSSF